LMDRNIKIHYQKNSNQRWVSLFHFKKCRPSLAIVKKANVWNYIVNALRTIGYSLSWIRFAHKIAIAVNAKIESIILMNDPRPLRKHYFEILRLSLLY
jgi:hypothetical protein